MQPECKLRIFVFTHRQKSLQNMMHRQFTEILTKKKFSFSVFKNLNKYSVISGIQKAFDFFSNQESLISTQYNVAQKKERMDSRNSGSMK